MRRNRCQIKFLDCSSPQGQLDSDSYSNEVAFQRRKNGKPKDKVQGSVEEALMRELRFGGIDKENLKELVEIVAAIQKGGLKRIKVFPKGVPVVDSLRVSGCLTMGK